MSTALLKILLMWINVSILLTLHLQLDVIHDEELAGHCSISELVSEAIQCGDLVEGVQANGGKTVGKEYLLGICHTQCYLPSWNRHFTMVEGFGCPNDPKSYVVRGYMPLLGSPKANWS